MRSFVAGLCLCFALLAGARADARDWFVRAGSDGDGSRAKPFRDPWQALDKAEAGDAIHVSAGKYYGQNGLGYWQIPYDNVKLIGGYDKDFKERDPWKNLSELLWDPSSKNWPKEARISSKAKDVTVDGFVIDMKDQVPYNDEQKSSRRDKASENAMYFSLPAIVKNCVIINPGDYAISTTGAAVIENNLVINAIGWGVNIRSGSKDVAQIKNNTIVFTWTFKEPGKGAYQGSPVSIQGPANISGNILAHSDNNGIYQTQVKPERVSVTNNVFFMNLFSNFKIGFDGKDIIVDDKSMDMLDEVGFKAFDGNEIKNPQLPLDPVWLEKYQQRTAGSPGKLVMDDFNKLRQALGMNLQGGKYNEAAGVAPFYPLDKALLLMAPKAAIKAGARKIALKVDLPAAGTAEAAAPSRSYQKMELAAFVKAIEAYSGKAVEAVVAVGGVTNIGGMPKDFEQKQYAGMTIYDRNAPESSAIAFYKLGSSAQRAMDAATGWYQGHGKPDRLFVAKGVVTLMTGYPKFGFQLDSLEPFEAAPASGGPAVQGRDWFVRVGSSGNGSKEKPFKDPFLALDKAEAGDTIHVAEGEYNGKLKKGQWQIDTDHITLLGGYDRDFKVRNPWKHMTVLQAGDTKVHKSGYTIEGVDDHSFAVIDGFVFDKVVNNKYDDGDLDYSRSDKSEHIWLFKPGCVIRNNMFLNGAEGALRVTTAQTVENNIFINHYQKTVTVTAHDDPAPFIFKNNTVLFAWEMKFGEGKGRGGHLLDVQGRVKAVIDNNIFEFADNDAIRISADTKDVELTRNTFNHNLWSNVQRPSDWVVVDDKTFAQLGDLGWKKNTDNAVVSANIPLPQKWFDVYLHRTASVPGKVTMDDWNKLREVLGQPVIATGGKAGSGMAPAFPWKEADKLMPKNPKVTAGARQKDLPVSFNGVERKEEAHDYDESSWDVAKSADAWAKLDGKRVALKVVFQRLENQFQLSDVKKESHTAFMVVGPEGTESGGLPMRAYVKKGGKPDRTIRAAKTYSSGQVDQVYLIKGVVRENRQMVVEQVERAD